jgi:tetratricopeptide (TPR) repeat protein
MHEEAVRAFRKAVELMPDRADHHAALAAALKGAGRPAASAAAYRKAFTLQPALADNLRQAHRYQASRAAVLAGSGQGKDAGDLDAAQRADWRKGVQSLWHQAFSEKSQHFRRCQMLTSTFFFTRRSLSCLTRGCDTT